MNFRTLALARPCRVAFCVGVLLALLVASGCADQAIRKEADSSLREARYEEALDTLQSGLKRYPDSPLLRSGAIQANNEAMARLLAEAASARATGEFDKTEALLKRAQRFDTGGKRASSLLAELQVERRQRAALESAEDLLAKKNPRGALLVLGAALKDNPKQADLLALQRRLLAEERRLQSRAAQQGLTETRPISLDFRDANLRTVLDVVTRTSGVNFILDKDIRTDVRVTVFLRSARVEDAIDLIVSTHQLAKKVVDAQTILIYPNTQEKQREHQEQVVRVFYLANAEAKGAAGFLRSMVRMREPFVDERSNMLALRDTPDVIELAERLIGLFDTHDSEVLLELEVLEIRTSSLLDLGVKFPDTFGLLPLAAGGVTGLTVNSLRELNSDRVGVSIGGILFNLKREVGDFNTLANPRIRVRNREKAKVLIGDKVPIVTATTGQGGFVADSISYLDVGLKLDVEPTIFADDDVGIRVSLEVSSLAREIRTNSGTLAYQVGTRSASTVLRLRDGETQLLAGLISRDERTSASRIPGLGDLPVAGRLFSSQRDESQRTELVLAITPRVVRNIRRPDASESELWIGTELNPRIRAVGGQLTSPAAPGVSGSSGQGRPAEPQQPSPTLQQITPSATSPSPAISLAQPPTLRWHGPTEVAVGDSLVVTLQLNSMLAMRGGPLTLTYGKGELELLGVDEGGYYKSDGAVTSFTSAVDTDSRTVRVGVMRNQASGLTGQAAVVRLRLRALRAGSAEVGLTSYDAVAATGELPRLVLPPPLRVQVR